MSLFRVTDECLELGLRARAIAFAGVKIAPAPPGLRSTIDGEADRIRRQFADVAAIRELPEIERVGQVLRSVGVKPRRNPPSSQKLLEYAWKRGTLPSINDFVDTYNLMSLRTQCSLGAHDLDLVDAPIELRIFRGDEVFRPLGSEADKDVKRGEFGYVDGRNRVVCRLDSLQAEFSKVTAATARVLLIVESTTAHSDERLDAIVEQTVIALQQHCETGRVEAVF
ncbi:MAG: phenylalanine--tRNA ligase beta subunit-related protein [Pirellulaceae bacterium]|jgi:DNA/RNA-binding domain of Phe-tRNA-synthetase-like protein|nr:phenylalanine--tRNA ligase beta subunit-related protein [Pirellulaceae bacterium]MDP7018580.1 phenylalanine--tRNA ligase beta subunit-related protein [Pirellulaceae bacterium]